LWTSYRQKYFLLEGRKLIEQWIYLRNEKLYTLYSSANITSVTESEGLKVWNVKCLLKIN